jgi:C1A family cysteine protease
MPTLGYRPDPPKARHEKPDLVAEPMLRAAPPPPSSASIRHFVVDVLDQGGIGSCVSQSILQAVRCSHRRQGVENPVLGSRLFGYYLSRAYHHQTGEDSGTFLRLFFQALTKFGFCPETLWPYSDDSERFKRMPPSAAFRAAFDQANPTTYRRITGEGATRLDQIKRAIAAGYPVCFGTNVDNDFCNNRLVEPLQPPRANIAGGHALLVVGYENDFFEVVNSWSSSWGDEGYCRFSLDYMSDPSTRDLWIVEHSPKYSSP